MLTNSGFPTVVDPSTHQSILAHKIKIIDRRRAELEPMIAQLKAAGGPPSTKLDELECERRDLLNQRRECESILHPARKPARTPELERLYTRQREADKLALRVSLRHRTEQAIAAAEALEAQGEHRQARLTRATIPELAAQIIREFNFDPALLSELET
jgi:hypothetical protein